MFLLANSTKIMKTKKTSNQHTQLSGVGVFDNNKYFTFSPDAQVNGVVHGFRKRGHGQQLPNGTFSFVADEPSHRSQATMIKKLLHGKLSLTKNGLYQLTLRFDPAEKNIINVAMLNEAGEAAEAINLSQPLRRRGVPNGQKSE
jgi:hypothetical protein